MAQGSTTSTSECGARATARWLAALLCPSPNPAVVMMIRGGAETITAIYIADLFVASIAI